MYKELFICDKEFKQDELQDVLFKAIKLGVTGFSVCDYFLKQAVDIIPHFYVISTPIDYPSGTSSQKMRSHAILEACHKGVTAVDLVVNTNAANNLDMKFIRDDISVQHKICQDKGVTLRVMMEYRSLEHKSFMGIKEILEESGISYVFPATGYFIDQSIDNMLMGKILQKDGKLSVISNGSISNKKEYDRIAASGLFGIRFRSIYVVESCLGV